MVPPGVAQLTPEKRRSVEHHMRHCAICKSRAALLTSPVELLGGIALLPLPASLAHGWPPKAPALQNAQLSAARQSWADRLRTRGFLIGGLALLFLGGGAGGVVILHGSQRPAIVITPRHQPTPVAAASSFPTFTLFPTPPPPSPTPAPGQWGDAQALVRNANGYHVHYGSYYVYPDGGPAGSPLTFDLVVQPNGDYSGTYDAIDGYIGQFDIRRVSGVISVRHLNLVGNLGIQGAPPDTYQFFGITSQQGRNLGDSWLPLTGSAQQPAARMLSSALAPYVSAQQLADVVLAPPQGVSLEAGPGADPGSTDRHRTRPRARRPRSRRPASEGVTGRRPCACESRPLHPNPPLAGPAALGLWCSAAESHASLDPANEHGPSTPELPSPAQPRAPGWRRWRRGLLRYRLGLHQVDGGEPGPCWRTAGAAG